MLSTLPDVWCLVVVVVIAVVFVVVGTGVVVAKITIWRGYFLFPSHQILIQVIVLLPWFINLG